VLFSDESTLEVLDEKCQYVRRKPGEMYSPSCIVKTVKHPASVMVWSTMSVHGVGRLYIVEGRMNQHQYIKVLQTRLLPDLSSHFPDGGAIFQQDGAPCHTAKSVKAFLDKNKVCVLPWPSHSPDMSPIENLWMVVKRRISQRCPTSKIELIEALIDVWNRDPEIKELCKKLIKGMPKRIGQLLKAKGASTKY